MQPTSTPHRSQLRHISGLTLLELMVVLVIIGILGSIVTYNVIGAADKARKSATLATMKNLQGALRTYRAEYSSYPSMDIGLDALRLENMITDEIKDAWGNPFEYYTPAPPYAYEIISMGKDKEPGTIDDIIVHPSEAE